MEPAPEGKPWVDVTDPIDSLPEPQRTNAKRIRALVTSLRKVRPPSKYGMFLKTFAPDLYADDGSPVEVTEMKTVRSLRMM
jgi:hypothetical protein